MTDQVASDEIAKKTLVLKVFDWDLITGDDDIGEVHSSPCLALHCTALHCAALQVRIPLKDKRMDAVLDEWKPLLPMTCESSRANSVIPAMAASTRPSVGGEPDTTNQQLPPALGQTGEGGDWEGQGSHSSDSY
jgi:hypothetical protein